MAQKGLESYWQFRAKVNSRLQTLSKKVDNINIGGGSSGTTGIPDSSITTAKIADNAVTKEKLAEEVIEALDQDAGYLYQLKSASATDEVEVTSEETKVITYSRSTLYGNTQ